MGLLGPNGSGKSTLIKLMLGLLQPDIGEVNLGVDRKDIRMIPDFPILPGHLTVDEWIDVLEAFYGELPAHIDVETEFRLNGTWKIGNLSVGQKRLVSLMPIFFGVPKLLLMDEPTNFLDVIIRNKVLALIKERVQTTKSKVIISSHRIDEMELFASEIIMLNRGKLVTKVSLKFDTSLGYSVRVSNVEAMEKYLKKNKVEYEIEETLLGRAVNVSSLGDLFNPLRDFSKEGGYVFNITAINNLQERLGDLR